MLKLHITELCKPQLTDINNVSTTVDMPLLILPFTHTSAIVFDWHEKCKCLIMNYKKRKLTLAEMSVLTYTQSGEVHKDLVWIKSKVKSPPFSKEARIEAGFLLRLLQNGSLLGLPCSRPMPIIGKRCHELRIIDKDQTWRIIYRIDNDAIILTNVFAKKTQKMPQQIIVSARKRLREYDLIAGVK